MQIFEKEEGYRLLKDNSFIKAWKKILDECPWGTVFQSSEFVVTWFEFYKDYYPIIVTDWDGKSLNGILTLTSSNGVLVAAGTNQSEYQTWISTLEKNECFIQNALKALMKKYPSRKIHFKYISHGTPMDWVSSTNWKKRTIIKIYQQPLMKIDSEFSEQELKKKNRKEKINRLKRKGTLDFKEVLTIDRFKEIIEELLIQSDFRKGAMYDKVTFLDEPERKQFLIRLFELNLLHVSILTLENKIIASNAGIKGLDILHLQGINTHSPFFSKYSPGILLFLFLGIYLEKRGIKYFDLTPGGAGGYKDMLATKFGEVYELTILPVFDIFIETKKEFLIKEIKKIYEKTSFFKESKTSFSLVIQKNQKKLKLYLKNGLKTFKLEKLNKINSKGLKIDIKVSKPEFNNNYKNLEIHKNSLADLLLFDEKHGKITRWEFLEDCMKRIEMNQSFFSIKSEKLLIAVLWYIPIETNTVKSLNQKDLIPELPLITFSNYLPDFSSFLLQIISIVFDKITKEESNNIESILIQTIPDQKLLLKTLKNHIKI
jgi:CelD/BcsL family acetyltransferase involved in cellulose biosynthesis